MNEPKLRFPEFTGEWEEKKLGEFFHLQNGYAFRSDAYIADGKYKIVTIANVQSGKLDLSKTNSINQLPSNIADHQKLNIGDIILSMTGNVGRVCMVDQHNCLLNQRVGLLKQINEHVDRRYVYSVINSKQFETAMIKSGQGAAQANISKEDVEAYSFWAPTDPAEQEKIADCLSSMDELIAAQAEKVEALKEKKTGLMQQLFPQPGETTPRLRFPEFTGEWEVKKLGEVFTRLTEKNTEDNKNVLTISAQYGLISQLDFFKKSVAASDVTGYYLLHKGDFAYNKSSSQGKPVGAIKPLKLYDKGVVSTLYICFRCNNPREIGFWEQYFDAGILDKEIMSIAQEGARNHGLLNVPTTGFFELNIITPPSPAEQEKIADCLSILDAQITAETEKLTALKDYKKGLMQQLFPQPAK
jgi:type I restriction enzyme S subunit